MKHLWKIFLVVTLILVLVFALASCGDKPNPDPNPGDNTGGNNNQGGNNQGGNQQGGGDNLLTMDVSGVRFAGKYYAKDGVMGEKTLTYNGKLQTFETYTGNPSEERASETFTYWNATDDTKVADSEGVKEPGTYIVHLTFSYPGYKDAVVKAKLIINQSYEITYVGPTGMNKGNNPDKYSLSDNKLLYEATVRGQKFKGWYSTENYTEGTEVTRIVGSELGNGGNITLYAKFQPYVEYPTKYHASAKLISDNGGVIPAIPGFDNLDATAVPIIDLQQNIEDARANGFSYNSKDVNSLPQITYNNAVLTAGGQPVLEWQEYGNGLNDDETLKVTRNQFMYRTPTIPANHEDYTTIEFWVYSERDTGDVFTAMFLTNNVNNQAFTFDITLNFTGWKKFTITKATDAYAPAGATMLVHEIRFMAVPYNGLRSDHATLGFRNASENRVFFSSIYFTKNNTTMEYLNNTMQSVVVSAFEKLGNQTTKALLTDSEVAAYLADSYDWSALNFADTFATTYKLATVWNSTTSTYKRNDALLAKIAEQINTKGKALTTSWADGTTGYNLAASLDLVRTVAIISDYVSSEHGAIWMIPVDGYFPGAGSTPSDKFNSNVLTLISGLAAGNSSKVNSSIKAIASIFEENGLTVLSDLTLFEDYANILVSCMDTQLYDPSKTTYVDNLFTWFTQAVDSFTQNGRAPFMDTRDNLVRTIQGMLMIYPYASADSQNTFASQLKYYLASDATLEAKIKDAKYDLVSTNLDLVKANTTAAKTGDSNACYVFEADQQAILKKDGVFVVIKGGMIYDNTASVQYNHSVSMPGEITSFKGMANSEGFVIVVNNNLTVSASLTTGKVVVDNVSQGVETATAGVYAFIKSADTLSGKTITSTSDPMIVLFETVDGKIVVTVYNYKDIFGSALEVYTEVEASLDKLYDTITSSFDPDLGTAFVIADTNESEVITFSVIVK